MYCRKCGARMPENTEYCRSCGYNNHTQTYANVHAPQNSPYGADEVRRKSRRKIIWIVLAAVAALLLITNTVNLDDVEQGVTRMLSPDYISAIKSESPPGYDNAPSIGYMFDHTFSDGKWTVTSGSDKKVCYTGIINNGNGTYSQIDVVFSITDMGDEFYYGTESVTINGADFGVLSSTAFWNALCAKYGNL